MATYVCLVCEFKTPDDDEGVAEMEDHLTKCQPRDLKAEAHLKERQAALEEKRRQRAEEIVDRLMERLGRHGRPS